MCFAWDTQLCVPLAILKVKVEPHSRSQYIESAVQQLILMFLRAPSTTVEPGNGNDQGPMDTDTDTDMNTDTDIDTDTDMDTDTDTDPPQRISLGE